VLAKNEVHGPLYVTTSIDLVSDLSKKGILVSVKSDTVVTLGVTISRQGNGLGTLAVGVLDIDVVECSVCCIVLDGSSGLIISSTTEQTGAVLNDDYVAGVGRGIFSVAVDGESGFATWNNDLFLVCSGEDEQALGSRWCCAQRINGSLDLNFLAARIKQKVDFLTVVYFPPEPTVIAPEGAVVRLAASTVATKEESARI
jgi:hypothetical protein